MRALHHRFAQMTLFGLVRLMVGAYRNGPLPTGPVQIFFANHTSHLDTLTLLAALPKEIRARTRPVAARDYWCATPLRRWVAENVLNVIYLDRTPVKGQDLLAPIHAALDSGESIIIFPEGTRHTEAVPHPFKGGLFRIASAYPHAELVPVYLENLYRILPKGAALPVPLINKVMLGPLMHRQANETKPDFLHRARMAVCALCSARS